jgi:hypothetical protein
VFVVSQNLRVLDKATPAEGYDLKTLAGGLKARDQIQLCQSIRSFDTS